MLWCPTKSETVKYYVIHINLHTHRLTYILHVTRPQKKLKQGFQPLHCQHHRWSQSCLCQALLWLTLSGTCAQNLCSYVQTRERSTAYWRTWRTEPQGAQGLQGVVGVHCLLLKLLQHVKIVFLFLKCTFILFLKKWNRHRLAASSSVQIKFSVHQIINIKWCMNQKDYICQAIYLCHKNKSDKREAWYIPVTILFAITGC